jgi:predicted nuclease with RNAse H fold
MSASEKIWIGADPGGEENFGIAIIRPEGPVVAFCVNCATAAFDSLQNELNGRVPTAAGIDAPLWWSSGPHGWRNADLRIRVRYPALVNVLAINSLWGSVLIQGVLFAHLLRRAYPAIGLTETHPKAVLEGWGHDRLQELLNGVQAGEMLNDTGNHKRDAVISAIAAREGFSENWKEDLSCDRPPNELNPSSEWLNPMHYFWPERLPNEI